MYSVVLATMLTTGSVAPSWGFGWCGGCHGCHGCYGCWGGCYGCYGCCGGCYGCHGCYGCWGGCYGCCGGCYGCYGCCGGCYGASVVYQYPVYSYGCCGGCYGAPVVAPAVTPARPGEPAREKLPAPAKTMAPSNFATVVIAAPAGTSVTVNGTPIAMKATEQSFLTPDLEPGANYSYVVEAKAVRDGETVSQSRKVMIAAGSSVRVDFSQLAAAAPRVLPVANRD